MDLRLQTASELVVTIRNAENLEEWELAEAAQAELETRTPKED